MKLPGKKIGDMTIVLDRVTEKVRWGAHRDRRASFQVELRFDIHSGSFYAKHDGTVYEAKTKAELHDLIKSAIARTIEIVWERYLVINYDANHRVLEYGGHPAGRSHETLEIGHERDFLVRDHLEHRERPGVITGIELLWKLEDFSRPWRRPETGATVRSSRSVAHWLDGDHEVREQLGDPIEHDDATLPPGAVLWTAEREAFLRSVLAALAQLDAKMVELFRGDPDDVAKRLDQGAFSLLLAGAAGAAAAIEPTQPITRRTTRKAR